MSTLVTFIERAADLLSGIDGLHWKRFERLGTHRDVFELPLEQLTPAAFKKSLEWPPRLNSARQASRRR